jgi:hypothetical protein
MRPEISTIVLAVLAVAFGVLAHLKDPGLPVLPSLAFPVLTGWPVKTFYRE